MAKIGALHLMWAPFTTADTASAAPVYETTSLREIAELAKADWTPSNQSGSQYGNDMEVEHAAKTNGGTIAAEVTDLSITDRTDIYGGTYDASGETLSEGVNSAPPYGGVAYVKHGKRAGVEYYEPYFYPKVIAAPSAETNATATDAIATGNEALALTVMPRLNDKVYRVVGDRVATDALALAWIDTQFGKTST